MARPQSKLEACCYWWMCRACNTPLFHKNGHTHLCIEFTTVYCHCAEGLFGEYYSAALGQQRGTRWPLTPLRCTFPALRWTFPALRWTFPALRWTFPALRCSDNARVSLPKSFIVIVFTPCTNFPFAFRAKRRLTLYSTSEVTSQSRTNKWLLGDFWTLLAQCC